jgi:hypothetical protein
MSRTLRFEVNAEIPCSAGRKMFRDLLAAGWGYLREPAIGPLETVGLGLTWWTRRGEGTAEATFPLPWSLVRNGLVDRGVISKKTRVFLLRSEVVYIRRTEERPRLVVVMETK